MENYQHYLNSIPCVSAELEATATWIVDTVDDRRSNIDNLQQSQSSFPPPTSAPFSLAYLHGSPAGQLQWCV